MATLKLAPHIMTVRGHVGNLVYSMNRPGNFIRERALPRYSQTLPQLNQRSRHAIVVDYWRNTLNDAQRIVWNDLALVTVFRSPTCNAYHPSGFSLFLRANVFRLSISQAIVAVPDTVAAALPSTITVGAGAMAGHPYITADANWHDGKTGYLKWWHSPFVSQSTYYHKGPWPLTSNTTIITLDNLPYFFGSANPIPDGQRCFYKFKAFYGTQGTIITWPQHTHMDYTA